MRKIFLIIFFSLFNHIACHVNNSYFTIMINPAGDAKDAGRTLYESFERGIAMQFSQALKQNLEINFNNIRVVLTRLPGEEIEVLQNANFANRLATDLFLSLHFYNEEEAIPKVCIYYYLQNTFFSPLIKKLDFYNYDNANLVNISRTVKYANIFKNIFYNHKNFELINAYGIPFKQLIGITSPAIAIEIGVTKNYNMDIYINLIQESLREIINYNFSI